MCIRKDYAEKGCTGSSEHQRGPCTTVVKICLKGRLRLLDQQEGEGKKEERKEQEEEAEEEGWKGKRAGGVSKGTQRAKKERLEKKMEFSKTLPGV